MNCQNCQGQNLTKFLDLGYQPPPMVFPSGEDAPETLYPLYVLRCSDCGLVQNGYTVDPKLLFSEYQYNSAATPSFAKHLDGLAQTVMDRFHPSFVVDIGCSDGTLLDAFKRRGTKVLGVEPSEVYKLAEKRGIDVFHGFFDEGVAQALSNLSGPADIITATNVFGHVAALDSFVRGIDRLLSPNGVFVSEHTYLLDMVQKLEYDVIYHEHLRHYSLGSITDLLRRRGFEVFDAERIPTFGGSIRVFAQRLHGKERPSSSLLSITKEELDAGLEDPETYFDFARKVRESKIELNALLYKLKAEGKSIVGIGAPARASTLLGYCSIGPDVLDYVCETSPLKIGRLTPLTRVPVVDEKRLYEDKPDYALLLSWHLADELMPKLREKGYRGKFIIPLSNLKVIQ